MTFIKTEEVAQRLGVTSSTIRRLVEAGTLPAYRIGSQLRFDAHEVETYSSAARTSGRKDDDYVINDNE